MGWDGVEMGVGKGEWGRMLAMGGMRVFFVVECVLDFPFLQTWRLVDGFVCSGRHPLSLLLKHV